MTQNTFNAWNVLTPIITALIGAVGGGFFVHWLTRSREREAWLRDCKKEEWRELFTAMAKAELHLQQIANALNSNSVTQAKLDDFNTASNDVLVKLMDRVFIADELVKSGMTKLWIESQRKIMKDRNMDAVAIVLLATVKEKMVSMATREHKSFWQRTISSSRSK